ncbi:MAG: hypothetical protein GC191_05470 [Azospirillum sp.]|nr:hypothetical protein [Azospirillum sp.]
MNELITAIDHAIVGVENLDAARADWTALGFTLTPRGRHVGWGTANHGIMFPNDYVTLLAIVDPGQFVNNLDSFLEQRGPGLLGIALNTPDAAAAHGLLSGLGLTEAPRPLSRFIDLPNGTAEARFHNVLFKAGGLPGVNAYIIEHLTPELIRSPDWITHPNGAIGLEGVSVMVEEPRDLIETYQTLFGRPALETGHGRLDVTIGSHILRLLSRDRLVHRYPGLEIPHETPHALVLTLRCADLLTTRKFLTDRGYALVPVQGLRLVLPPTAQRRMIIEFVPG